MSVPTAMAHWDVTPSVAESFGFETPTVTAELMKQKFSARSTPPAVLSGTMIGFTSFTHHTYRHSSTLTVMALQTNKKSLSVIWHSDTTSVQQITPPMASALAWTDGSISLAETLASWKQKELMVAN